MLHWCKQTTGVCKLSSYQLTKAHFRICLQFVQLNSFICLIVWLLTKILPVFFVLKVPENFQFVDVMDLFFKVHKIFDLDFHPSNKSMMNFIEVFIFEMNRDNIVITSAMNSYAKQFLGIWTFDLMSHQSGVSSIVFFS